MIWSAEGLGIWRIEWTRKEQTMEAGFVRGAIGILCTPLFYLKLIPLSCLKLNPLLYFKLNQLFYFELNPATTV